MRKLTLNLLKLYKKFLSPNNFGTKTCIFEPSCSVYTYQAVEKYGALRGLLMGLQRVIRCNPFSKGGLDPVR